MRFRFLAAAAMLAACAGAPPRPAPEAEGLQELRSQLQAQSALVAQQQRRIDDAVVNGVWFLRGQQHDDGTWGEEVPEFGGGLAVTLTALPGLTLLECGVPASDPG